MDRLQIASRFKQINLLPLKSFLIISGGIKKNRMAPFMEGVQMPQGYRASTRSLFTFYHRESSTLTTRLYVRGREYFINSLRFS